MGKTVVAGMTVLLCSFGLSLNAATVTVDRTTQYQTIEGLGAGIHSFQAWKERQGPFYVDVDLDAIGFYDTLVSQLGITLIRRLEEGTEEVDSGSLMITSYFGRQLMHEKKFLEAAQRQNEPMLYIASVLSPPAYMKVSDTVPGLFEAAPNYNTTDCRLRDGYDDAFAGFVVRYLQAVRDSLGVEQHYLSIQNEPAFQEPYASCVYNGPRYTSVTKAVGQALQNAGLSTGLFGAEHMAWAFPNTFENFVRQDGTALAYMHAWAVHGYRDGVAADTGSFGGSTPTDKALWMSETSGESYGTTVDDWAGAMTLGGNMLAYLRNARISAWNFLHIMVNGNPDDAAGSALYYDGQPTAKGYVATHFYRYIRPGARQVASTIGGAGVEAVAFWHEGNQCLAVVLRNPGAATTVSLAGADLPAQMEFVVSTQADKLVTSTVDPTSSLSLPATSIATLVAGTYRGSGAVAAAPQARACPAAGVVRTPGSVKTYTIRGSLVRSTAPAAAGVRLETARNRHARRSVAVR